MENKNPLKSFILTGSIQWFRSLGSSFFLIVSLSAGLEISEYKPVPPGLLVLGSKENAEEWEGIMTEFLEKGEDKRITRASWFDLVPFATFRSLDSVPNTIVSKTLEHTKECIQESHGIKNSDPVYIFKAEKLDYCLSRLNKMKK